MAKKQKQEEFECDCCGRVLTPTQMKIEKKINTDLSPCFCNIIIELDKKNKKIKKLEKANSRYFSYLMEIDVEGKRLIPPTPKASRNANSVTPDIHTKIKDELEKDYAKTMEGEK